MDEQNGVVNTEQLATKEKKEEKDKDKKKRKSSLKKPKEGKKDKTEAASTDAKENGQKPEETTQNGNEEPIIDSNDTHPEILEDGKSPDQTETKVISSEDGPPEEPKIPEYQEPEYHVPKAVKAGDVEALRDLDEAKLMELKEAFALFDLDQDGVIDHCDLKATFLSLGQEDVTDDQVAQMLSEAIDPMDFDSFVVLMGYKTIELDPEDVIKEALSKWDKDQSGLISDERIREDLMYRGDKFTAKEVNWALEEAPVVTKPKGLMIDYVQFCRTLCGLRRRTE